MATMYNKPTTGEHYLSHSISEVVNLLHLNGCFVMSQWPLEFGRRETATV